MVLLEKCDGHEHAGCCYARYTHGYQAGLPRDCPHCSRKSIRPQHAKHFHRNCYALNPHRRLSWQSLHGTDSAGLNRVCVESLVHLLGGRTEYVHTYCLWRAPRTVHPRTVIHRGGSCTSHLHYSRTHTDARTHNVCCPRDGANVPAGGQAANSHIHTHSAATQHSLAARTAVRPCRCWPGRAP